MENINIGIYLNDYSKLGGVERVTSNLLVLLQQKYNVTTLLSLHKANDVVMTYLSVNVYVLKKIDGNKIGKIIRDEQLTHLIVQVQDLFESYQLCCVAMQNKCKAIPVLHSSPYCYIRKYGSWMAQISSMRSVLQYIKMQIYWRPKHLKLFHFYLQNVGLIVCVSKNAMKELKTILRIPEDDSRIDYIYNPISFELAEFNDKKENILLYAGRLSFEKQPLRMLEIWKEIYMQCPSWEFYILGDGAYRKRMEEFVRRNNLRNVKFFGVVQNVDEYMKRSKITLLCSYYEGLPTVLLEASVYENALVALKGDGGIADIIQDGENGFLVEKEDNACLINRLLHLMKNEKVCFEMGCNARICLDRYSNSEILRKWDKYLQ